MRTVLMFTAIAALCFGLEEKKPAAKEGFIHYRYFNGFEEANAAPFTQWAKNSDVTVNFMGVTDEKAAGGKKSFKIDITFNSGTYYYVSLPLNVPCEGDIVFKCSLFIDKASTVRAIPGLDFLFPPTKDSGVYRCQELDTVHAWMNYRDEAIVPAGKKSSLSFFRKANTPGLNPDTGGKIIDRIGLLITGGAPGKRIIAYIDDVELHGTVPDPASYKKLYETRIAAGKIESRERAGRWQSDLAALKPLFDVPVKPGYGESYKAAVLGEISAISGIVADMLARDAVSFDIEPRIRFLMNAAPEIQENLRRLSAKEASGMVVHMVDPVGQYPVLPDTKIIHGEISARVNAVMCRNEYESASFVVTAIDDIAGLTAEISDLTGPGTYPSSKMDIKLVKCWYQVAYDPLTPISARPKTAGLYPELLLNDDALVRVDTAASNNHLRVGTDYQLVSTRKFGALGRWTPSVDDYPVRDSAVLKPVTVARGKNQQFVVTFRPADVPAGTYKGTLKLSAGSVKKTLSVELTMLDFSLVKQENFISSAYYVARLDPTGKGTVSSEHKNEQQYFIDMSNMAAYGIDNPTVYEKFMPDPAPFEKALSLRAKAGIDNSVIFSLGITTAAAGTEAGDKSIIDGALRGREIAAKYGCKEFFVYGIDEAVGDRVMKQRKVWEELNKLGIKVFVAGYPGGMKGVAHALNVYVCALATGPGIDRDEVALFHKHGNRVISYNDPQIGVEDPYIYRKNYGIMLAAYGIDGAMDYAYQHSFGNIWDDFDDFTYKDHVFAYPTADGVVNTLPFIGYREGMDDMRYVATLRKAIAQAKAKGDAKAAAAQSMLDGILKTFNDSGNGDEYVTSRFGNGAYIDLGAQRTAIIQAIQSLNYR